MVYPIYVLGSKILREKAINIDASYPNLKELVNDMWETMRASDGVGLAAPQIGLGIRVFVVDAAGFKDDYPDAEGFKKVFINAEIYEEFGEMWSFNEGCLSVPGVRADVQRYSSLRIKYVDENFVEQDETLSGVVARIVRHEYDHIEGKVFVDRISPIRKSMLKKRLLNMTKGIFSCSYKTKIIQ